VATLDPALPVSGWVNTATFGEPGGWEVAHSVARGTNGFVALGARWEPLFVDIGFTRARERMWTSADGQSWAEMDLGPVFEGVTLVDVVATPDGGFAAFGSRAGEEGPYGRPPLPTVWRSQDGQTWEGVESGLPQIFEIGKVVQGAVGYLLLGPQMGYADPLVSGDPSLWFSHDALTWQEVQHYSQAAGGVKLDDIGAGDEGFVAFGIRQGVAAGDWERFAVASADGREWIDSPRPFGNEDPAYQPDAAIAPLGPDWIASMPGPNAASAQLWFSANGIDWERLGSVEDGIGEVRATNGRVFLSLDAANPYSPPPGVWISIDGRHWEPFDLGARAAIGDVATGPLGPVLVGSISLGAAEANAAFWLWREE
jgi:hypothetical protein